MARTKNKNGNGNGKGTFGRTRFKTVSLITDHGLVPIEKGLAGAPTQYRPVFNELARNYCLLGAKDTDLAYLFGVCEATIKNWKNMYPRFIAAINKAKLEADGNMVASLYRRGLGYKAIEIEYKRLPIRGIVKKGGVETEEIIGWEMVAVKEVHKQVAGDTKAMEMWLVNRTRMLDEHLRWRRMHQLEVSGANGTPLVPMAESDAKAVAMRKIMLVELGAEVIDIGMEDVG